MPDKIYVPKVIAKEHGQFGSVNISLDVAALIDFANKHKDGRGYLKLKLCKKRTPGDKFGDTHYLELDTFVPDGSKRSAAPAPATGGAVAEENPPF